MVRLKHRYLLVNILYPEDKQPTSQPVRPSASGDVPQTVHFRRPSDDRVDNKMLMRILRDGVAELFGDYGSGMVASSLQSTQIHTLQTALPYSDAKISQSNTSRLQRARQSSVSQETITGSFGLPYLSSRSCRSQ